MAAIDASSPIRFAGTPNQNVDITSAAFTPPDASLVVACVSADTTANTDITISVSDSLGGTWTQQIEADEGTESAGGGGHASIWTRPVVSGASMTVGVRRTSTGGSTNAISVKVYVVTAYSTVEATGANNRGTSTTNSITTDTLTPGGNGLLIVCGTEWNDLGLSTSSNLTYDAIPASQTGISGGSGYRAVSNGVTTSANLDAAGTSAAVWQWAQIIVRDAATGGVSVLPLLGVG